MPFCNCTILHDPNGIGAINPFRWKGFYWDSESGLYYANGSYYDPETMLYLDAQDISSVEEKAFETRGLDRNGIVCNNILALAGSSATAATTIALSPDPEYDPGKTWWEKLNSWWQDVPNWMKVTIGAAFVVASVVAAYFTAGASLGLEAELLGAESAALAAAAKVALIELSIGIGFAAAGWASSSAMTGEWNTGELENSIAESVFFTGVFMFVSASINAAKYAYRVEPYPTHNIVKQYEFKSNTELEAHFAKHNKDFGNMYANAQEYLNGANYVIENGIYVPQMNGFLRFYGVIEKETTYAFVGMTNDGMHIVTYGIRGISTLKKVPWIIR